MNGPEHALLDRRIRGSLRLRLGVGLAETLLVPVEVQQHIQVGFPVLVLSHLQIPAGLGRVWMLLPQQQYHIRVLLDLP